MSTISNSNPKLTFCDVPESMEVVSENCAICMMSLNVDQVDEELSEDKELYKKLTYHDCPPDGKVKHVFHKACLSATFEAHIGNVRRANAMRAHAGREKMPVVFRCPLCNETVDSKGVMEVPEVNWREYARSQIKQLGKNILITGTQATGMYGFFGLIHFVAPRIAPLPYLALMGLVNGEMAAQATKEGIKAIRRGGVQEEREPAEAVNENRVFQDAVEQTSHSIGILLSFGLIAPLLCGSDDARVDLVLCTAAFSALFMLSFMRTFARP